MFSKVHTLAAVVIGFASLGITTSAKAQYPPMDMSGIVAMNQDFDRRFYAALPGLCMQTAIACRGQQLPFNAMTISQSNNELSAQYARNNANWANNSNIQMNAVGNWTNGAIRGVAPFSNGGGQAYMMPYANPSYYMQNGYMYNGYMPGGNNFYPSNYGYGR